MIGQRHSGIDIALAICNLFERPDCMPLPIRYPNRPKAGRNGYADRRSWAQKASARNSSSRRSDQRDSRWRHIYGLAPVLRRAGCQPVPSQIRYLWSGARQHADWFF